MKKLALLFLVLPLPAFAAEPSAPVKPAQEAAGNCDPRFPGYDVCSGYHAGATGTAEHKPFVSHWDVVSGRGAFLASGAEASAASTGDPSYPAGSYGGR